MVDTLLATEPRTPPALYDGFDHILVNGTWRHGRDGRVAEDLDPYTNDVLVRIPLADTRDLDEAFHAAAAAQPEWFRKLPAARAAILRRAAAILEERRMEIVAWLIHIIVQHSPHKALDRQAHEPGFPVIPVLLPGVVDPALGFLGLNTWVDLRQGLEDGASIEILARSVRGLPPGDEAAPTTDPRAAVCPYRGLLPFREEDASFFIGREDFTATLIDKVHSSSLVVVVGASGSGKSSVVRAGLVPALRRGANHHVWEVVTLTPGPTPLHALLAALSPPPEDLSRAARLARIEGDVALLREHGLTIEAFARNILSEQPGTDRLLLVVDQWEEIYTQAKSIDDRQRFLDLILQATAEGSVTVLLTLRGDFYGRALEHRAFADRL